MKDYTRGLRDGMLETAKADLEQVATRIAILEDDLHKERDRKWELIRKIKLLEAGQDPTRLLRTLLSHRHRRHIIIIVISIMIIIV